MTTTPSEQAADRQAAAREAASREAPTREAAAALTGVETVGRTAGAAPTSAQRTRAGHRHHRGAEPGPLARGGRRGRDLRHPGRRDPARLRPAVRLHRCATSWSATSRAPGTPPPATRRPPARSASASPPPGRARPTWSPRSPTRTWTRSRSWRSPVRCRSAAIGTDAFQEADIRGITMPITKHNFLVTDPDEIPQRIAEAFHLAGHRAPRPGAGGHPQGRAAGADRTSPGRRGWTCPATGRPPGRTASRSGRRRR